MHRDDEQNMGEVLKGIADDLDYSKRYSNYSHRRKSYDARRLRKNLFLWSAGILLTALIMVLLFRGENKEVSEGLATIKQRVVELEKRLSELERTGERVARLETRVKELKKSISKLHRSVASKTRKSPVVQKTSLSQDKARFHKVSPGDTLYGIAAKYGVTVDQLRRYNNLGENQGIRPGQNLRIDGKK